jgi:dsDNA-specific endonuclease/ATPase MutS2
MTENEGILELVDMLYNMISDAWGVPLGNDKCLIERDKALDLIEEIKNQLPAEIAEAKRLVSRRDDFITNAKREGESIRKMAEEQSRKLVEEQEIVKMARARAEELVATAENKSRELRRAANEYVDETLKGAEESVAQALDIVKQSRTRYRNAAAGYNAAAARKDDLKLDD